jgi:glutathione S-transferase
MFKRCSGVATSSAWITNGSMQEVFGVTDNPEYMAMNPNRLVPTIDDGDIRLWESNVIVRYLAQKHDYGRLCPADIATRFDAERWMDWQATVFWPALRPCLSP